MNAGGSTPTRSAPWRACTSRSCPWPTSTPSPSRRGCRATCRRCATRRAWCTSAPRVVASWRAGYERSPAPWGLGRHSRPTSTTSLLEPDWDRFAPLFESATARVPELADAEIVTLINGPEAFTPDGEFILGESDVGGFWVAAGFCAHGIAGAGGMGRLVARMDHRRPARPRRVGDGLAPLRSPVPEPGLHPGPGDRGLRHLLRREVPRPRARGGTSAARVARCTPGSRRAARPSARREAGSASTGSSPTSSAGDESLRPDGWAGQLWSPAIGAEHRACRDARRSVRRDVVRQARGDRAPARRSSSSGCAPTGWRASRARSPTPSCSIPAAASSAT